MIYYERGVFHVHHKIPFSACRGFRRADFFMQNSILTCHSLQVT
nr:MAG TPA: hypothetical protein [Caudoviricetes sp.]